MKKSISIADILGPWVDPDFESGVIQRCRMAWCKPLPELTNEELATFLRQDIAVSQVLPVAEERVNRGFDDDTELYDGELDNAIQEAKKKSSWQLGPDKKSE